MTRRAFPYCSLQVLPIFFVSLTSFVCFCMQMWNDAAPPAIFNPHAHLKGAKWWALHRYPFDEQEGRDFRNIQHYFTKTQWKQFSPKQCNHFFVPEILRATLRGLHQALYECEKQMANERWNCSRLHSNYESGGNIFGKMLLKAIPETSFVLAIVSAGVTASIARECKKSISCCPCITSDVKHHKVLPNAITYKNCDHNIKFAKRFSKRLLDRAYIGSDLRYMTMLHNYNAGRRAVVKSMKSRCICHGTSGGCTYRTCWKEVANFAAVGSKLKELFKNPTKVMQGGTQGIYLHDKSRPNGKKRKRLNLVKNDPRSMHRFYKQDPDPPRKSDLVYYEEPTPSFFCERNPSWGVLGTRGRVCNEYGGNCSHICCNKSHRSEYYKHVNTKCNCKFVWCCKVECQTCITDRERKVCN